MLEQNIKGMRLEPDDEAMEKSLYALGHLLYVRKRDYGNVRPVLEDAVTRAVPRARDRRRAPGPRRRRRAH